VSDHNIFSNGTGSPAEKEQPSDLFSNLDNLRISQDFAASLGVKKALLTIPVKKPSKEWFVRVNPAFQIQTCLLELKEDREIYLVSPILWDLLAGMESTFAPRMLFGATNRLGVFFIWPVRLPRKDGRQDEWSKSAMEAANMATKTWIRMQANQSLGAYEVMEATATLPEPKWPELSFNELLRIAFKDRLIDTLDHPVLLQLRGE